MSDAALLGERVVFSTVKVRLQRAYLWDGDGYLVSYGPGEVEIPRAMAEGLQREKVELGIDPLQEEGAVMHPKVFALREAEASARAAKAAAVLAEKFGIEMDALQSTAEQEELQQVLRNEAVADFLEALAGGTVDLGVSLQEVQTTADDLIITTEALLLARIEAIDGIGPKTMELIRDGLAESSVSAELKLRNDTPDSESTDPGETEA